MRTLTFEEIESVNGAFDATELAFILGGISGVTWTAAEAVTFWSGGTAITAGAILGMVAGISGTGATAAAAYAYYHG